MLERELMISVAIRVTHLVGCSALLPAYYYRFLVN